MTADEKRKLYAVLRGPDAARLRAAEATIERAGEVLRAEIVRLKAEIAREKVWRDG